MAMFDGGFITANIRGNNITIPTGRGQAPFGIVEELLHNVRREDIMSYDVENRMDTMSRVVTVRFVVHDAPFRESGTGDTRDDTQTEDYLTRIGVR